MLNKSLIFPDLIRDTFSWTSPRATVLPTGKDLQSVVACSLISEFGFCLSGQKINLERNIFALLHFEFCLCNLHDLCFNKRFWYTLWFRWSLELLLSSNLVFGIDLHSSLVSLWLSFLLDESVRWRYRSWRFLSRRNCWFLNHERCWFLSRGLSRGS